MAIGTGKWGPHELRQCAINIEAAILANWATFTLQREIKCRKQTIFNQEVNQPDETQKILPRNTVFNVCNNCPYIIFEFGFDFVLV